MHDFHTRACPLYDTQASRRSIGLKSCRAIKPPTYYFAYYFDVKKDNFERNLFFLKGIFLEFKIKLAGKVLSQQYSQQSFATSNSMGMRC